MQKLHQHNPTLLLLIAVCAAIMASCRDDDIVVYPTTNDTGHRDSTQYYGLYVLNEGNMGSNKCTLDFLDLTTGIYSRNIYPSRNPSQVMELGDVGNDIKIYGSSLWMVVNMSNKVEVADARTAVSRGHADIPNCRCIAFDGAYAYVSSYVGEIGSESVLGGVYKVDTATLEVTAKVTVGYQPDELAVIGGKLYVANSGGYQVINGKPYDRRVSVIDLKTFTKERDIDVAPNLSLIRPDKHGRLWVASRGDGKAYPSRLYMLEPDANGQMALTDSIDTPVGGMCIAGDSLFFYSSSAHTQGGQNSTFGLVDLTTLTITNRQPIMPPAESPIKTPYGIIVNPSTRDIYVMDATNYVSSGKLYCFSKDGRFKWVTWTGDIPGHACFLSTKADESTPLPSDPTNYSPYILAVDEYVPAPGQFVNTMPECTADDTPASVADKCTEAIGGNRSGLVTLGAYGGYITFHFDHSVVNVEGQRDIYIKGNAYTGNSEPGIVMVMQDTNRNGLPDDTWYEISGSADTDSVGKVVYGYEITYSHAPMADIPWTDNQGRSGKVERNEFHAQEYFPLWLPTPLTFKGTLLPRNAVDRGNGTTHYWWLSTLREGYADNYSNTDTLACSIDIGWAVDANRQPVKLDHIDFVRVYSGQNQQCGWIGETSTEISGAQDLHPRERLKMKNEK